MTRVYIGAISSPFLSSNFQNLPLLTATFLSSIVQLGCVQSRPVALAITDHLAATYILM